MSRFTKASCCLCHHRVAQASGQQPSEEQVEALQLELQRSQEQLAAMEAQQQQVLAFVSVCSGSP